MFPHQIYPVSRHCIAVGLISTCLHDARIPTIRQGGRADGATSSIFESLCTLSPRPPDSFPSSLALKLGIIVEAHHHLHQTPSTEDQDSEPARGDHSSAWHGRRRSASARDRRGCSVHDGWAGSGGHRRAHASDVCFKVCRCGSQGWVGAAVPLPPCLPLPYRPTTTCSVTGPMLLFKCAGAGLQAHAMGGGALCDWLPQYRPPPIKLPPTVHTHSRYLS